MLPSFCNLNDYLLTVEDFVLEFMFTFLYLLQKKFLLYDLEKSARFTTMVSAFSACNLESSLKVVPFILSSSMFFPIGIIRELKYDVNS